MTNLNLDLLQNVIVRAQKMFSTPALSLAVIQDGEIVYTAGFGTRTLGKDEPVDAETSYAIASMSKSFTTACIGMLVDEGKLHWDDRVQDVLPYFHMKDPFADHEYTIRDLLMHDSGIHSECGGTLWFGSDYSREEVVRRLRNLRPSTSFRSCFAYQNVFVLAAGQVVEAVTGISWDDFVQQRILDPIGMPRTFPSYHAMLSSGIRNVATPHAWIKEEFMPIDYRDNDNCGPAAGMHSTAVDLANYLRMYLQKGMTPHGRILSETSVSALQSGHIACVMEDMPEVPVDPRLVCNFPMYGYGWRVQDYCGFKEVAHSGGVDGMRGRMAIFPEKNCGVAVLTNSEDRRTYMSVMLTVYDMLLGLPMIDWPEKWEKGQPRNAWPAMPERVLHTNPSLPLSGYTGTYRDSVYGDIYVEENQGKLVLRFSHTKPFTADLEHWQFDSFQTNWRDHYIPAGTVSFEIGGDGKVKSLHLEQPRLLDVDFTELDPHIIKAE